MLRILFTSGLLSAALLAPSYAKDLGVQGTLWPIVEEDIRELMVKSASKVDWDAHTASMQSEARQYADRLPKRALPSVSNTETVWVDPSIELSSDIQAPVEGADGILRWQVLARKGTRVNPLSHTRPVTAFLMFNGNDPAQVDLVAAVLEKEPLRFVPVEAGQGSVPANVERLKRPVFHAPDAMLTRFQVTNLPALVYPGVRDRALYLGVTSFAPPFVPAAVLSTWDFNWSPGSKDDK